SEALDLIAGELTRVKQRHGNTSIFAGSYGWSSAGRFHHAQSQLKRFLNEGGGFVRSEGNYSYNAGLTLFPHIVSDFRYQVANATRWRSVAQHGDLAVLFGGAAFRNAQVSGGGVARHRLEDDLTACRDAGIEFVNFSPLRSDAAEALGAEWIAPRPGSDTAIMLALSHTLLAEDLHDRTFLDRYCVGFERVAAYLNGADGQPKDADWAAQLSEVPAETIRALARRMAAKRTIVCMAAGLQRSERGEMPIWATVTLAAMLGQVGLPGGGFMIGTAADAAVGTMARPFVSASFQQGANPVTDYLPVAMIADMLLNPGAPYDYNGERRTFPNARLVWWAGGNPFHHHQDLNRLHEAMQRPETVIVNEISWTACARHADIVLPVAAPQEREDFGAGTYDPALIPMPKAVEPQGDAREEFDIYADLAARLGIGERTYGNMTGAQHRQSMWRWTRDQAARAGVDLPDWDAFIGGEIVELADPSPDNVFLAEFRADPDKHPLQTPSGRIELFSEVIDGFGYADCPGQAKWVPPVEWLGAATLEAPLHLISGQPLTRLHGQHDEGAFSQSRKIRGREPVLINPADAAPRGIEEGDIVLLRNTRGRCLAGARVTEDVRPGVLFLWTGAWWDPDFDDPHYLDRHGNPNTLTHDRRTSRLSQGPAAQSALVEIERFEGEPPAVRAYEPPLASPT
ncbi:MAG: molybdopterin-dependent oxidoreductase, partial [Pseudomonadota bacterium]